MKTSDPKGSLRRFHILIADEPTASWGVAPPFEKRSILERPAPIAIVAPAGKQIVAVQSDNPDAKIFVDSLGEWQSNSMKVERSKIPNGTELIYVNAAAFPLTVETSDFALFAHHDQ